MGGIVAGVNAFSEVDLRDGESGEGVNDWFSVKEWNDRIKCGFDGDRERERRISLMAE